MGGVSRIFRLDMEDLGAGNIFRSDWGKVVSTRGIRGIEGAGSIFRGVGGPGGLFRRDWRQVGSAGVIREVGGANRSCETDQGTGRICWGIGGQGKQNLQDKVEESWGLVGSIGA